MIQLSNLTKKYGNKTAIQNLQLKIEKETVFGYLGPNGAGKTTTIRCLMGFIKPTSGEAEISGHNCWEDAQQIHSLVGYLPGEIHFIEHMTAEQYLKLMADLNQITNTSAITDMADRLQLPLNILIDKMSKGMKQKVGLIQSFLHNPEILILDEPTSGLDPLMQQVFIEMILEEKEKGKTILISSHLFNEVERTCDVVSIIREGEIVAVENVSNLKRIKQNKATVVFKSDEDSQKLATNDFELKKLSQNRYEVTYQGDVNNLIRALASTEIEDLELHHAELEDVFMHYYNNR